MDKNFANSVFIHALKETSHKYNLKIGNVTIQKYLRDFETIDNFQNYIDCIKDPQNPLRNVDFNKSAQFLQRYQSMGISMVNIFESDYPSALKDLDNPPSILYYYGDIKLANSNIENNISIVGTRKASLYGKHTTRALVQALSVYKSVIVSGLATGIDSEAHISAIESKTPTIAVLGAGLLQVNQVNKNLFDTIAKNPCNLILSEFDPQFCATTWSFPLRNRIISALSRATVIVEAGENSGALITARCSSNLKRKIFAIPGELNKDSFKGNNDILASGLASPIYSIEQLQKELNLIPVQTGQPASSSSVTHSQTQSPGGKDYNNSPDNKKSETPELKLNNICKKILEHICLEPVSFDFLVKTSGLNQISLSTNLSILEIQGYVKKQAGSRFIRT